MKVITEKDHEQDIWYEEAKKQTLESLPAFLKHLTEDYQHDYGTICHAIAAGAVATALAMDKSSSGGITGFQSGIIMWKFMKYWNGIDWPAQLIRYGNMLYPQYGKMFSKTISKDVWKWLQDKAKENIDKYTTDNNASSAVFAHWMLIASGYVPFGYTVEE